MANSAWGLDIGRSFIKVVQLGGNPKKRTLVAASAIATPGGGIQSESMVDLKKLSEAIKSCVNSAKVSGNQCSISLIESQVVTRLIAMPPLTEKELSSAINWEAEQYIPLPMKDVNLQYKIVSKAEESQDGKMSVLLVAAPKRVIDKYLMVIKNAGLTVSAVETESTALARALTGPQEPMSVILSMGAFSTELIICKNQNVLFTRSIATGGFNLTKAIMAEFNLPQAQAEEYKQTYGIVPENLEGKVAAVLRPILDVLVSEIQKAEEFVRGRVAREVVSKIITAGGGAFLPGLSQYLTEKTSLEVLLGDSWANFNKEGLIMKLPGQGSFYAVATGLAER